MLRTAALQSLLLLTSATLLSAPAARAQDFRWETNTELEVAYLVHKKLAEIPMRFGSEDLHRVQRFQPEGSGDYINLRYGPFTWDFEVLVFQKPGTEGEGPTTGDEDGPGEDGKGTGRPTAADVRAEFRRSRQAQSFEQWVQGDGDEVEPRDPGANDRKVLVDGKSRRAGGDRPASTWWEYTDQGRTFDRGSVLMYTTACAYDLGDKEVALVVQIPMEDKDRRPDRKWRDIAKRICESLKKVELESDGSDVKRDEFADTPEKQRELDKLKNNIGDLENWDYFTTPRFIITYSWEPGKTAKRIESYKFARFMAEKLEDIREKFEEEYPPYEGLAENYSVIRVCYDYDEFLKYGDTSPGVVGWFSPGTKELCVFNDTQKLFGDEDYTLGVCFHEAWHQYSDQYWPDVELHRWFDEGLAEYFGAFRKQGRRWKFQYHKGRYQSLQRQLNDGTYIPGSQIVNWSRAKFYGPRAPDHYAQGWAMVDFLKRGESRLRGRFEEGYKQILATYSEVCMNEKDPELAVKKAFEGVDIDAYDEDWISWVESGMIKK